MKRNQKHIFMAEFQLIISNVLGEITTQPSSKVQNISNYYTPTYSHIYAYVHTHMYMYTYAYTFTYIHTYDMQIHV